MDEYHKVMLVMKKKSMSQLNRSLNSVDNTNEKADMIFAESSLHNSSISRMGIEKIE